MMIHFVKYRHKLVHIHVEVHVLHDRSTFVDQHKNIVQLLDLFERFVLIVVFAAQISPQQMIIDFGLVARLVDWLVGGKR